MRIRFFLVYAYDDSEKEAEESLQMVKDDLVQMGVCNPKLVQFRRWKQCPHVDSTALRRGFYEKMNAMQGVGKIYLAGEIMSAISMDNCIWYSEELVNRYF